MEGLSTNIGSEKYVEASTAISNELLSRPRTNNAVERGQSLLRHFNAESLATFKGRRTSSQGALNILLDQSYQVPKQPATVTGQHRLSHSYVTAPSVAGSVHTNYNFNIGNQRARNYHSRFRNEAIKNLARTQLAQLEQKRPSKARAGPLDQHLRYKNERVPNPVHKHSSVQASAAYYGVYGQKKMTSTTNLGSPRAPDEWRDVGR